MSKSDNSLPAWLIGAVCLAIGLVLGLLVMMLVDSTPDDLVPRDKLEEARAKNEVISEKVSDRNSEIEELQARVKELLSKEVKAESEFREQVEALKEKHIKAWRQQNYLRADAENRFKNATLELSRFKQKTVSKKADLEPVSVRVAKKHVSKPEGITVSPKLEVKIRNRNNSFVEYTWRLEVENTGRRTITPTIMIRWLDETGFVLKDRYASSGKDIEPGMTGFFVGVHKLDAALDERFHEVGLEFRE